MGGSGGGGAGERLALRAAGFLQLGLSSEGSRVALAAAASASVGCWLGGASAASWVAGGGAASAGGDGAGGGRAAARLEGHCWTMSLPTRIGRRRIGPALAASSARACPLVPRELIFQSKGPLGEHEGRKISR